MTYAPVGSGDVFALDEDDGARINPNDGGYVTLGVDTYLFPIDGSDPDLISVQLLTDATIAFVATIETCNFPRYKQGMGSGTDDVTDWDNSGSEWTQENPTTAYVGTSGTGWSVTALTLTKTAGVGSAMVHLGNLGSRRTRLKLVVTTGGLVRVNRFGKK